MSAGLLTTVEVVAPSQAVVVSLNAGPQGEPGPVPVEVVFPIVGGTLGTQPTFNGDPLFTGSYVRSGQLVHFQIQVDFDNITSFGTGQYFVDLPFPSKYAYQVAAGCVHDISATRDYPLYGHVDAGETQLLLKSIDVQGQSAFNVPFAQGSPFTLATTDNFHISGIYIAEES
jgi:hypothetical protein